MMYYGVMILGFGVIVAERRDKLSYLVTLVHV